MIDITKFFIISQEQFNQIVIYLKSSLLPGDKEYIIAYLFANFFAYFLIIFTIIVSLKIYRKLRRKVYNARLI